MIELENISDYDIETVLLHKFVKRGAWHDYHIYESDIPKGFPPSKRNEIMKALKRLRREGLLLVFPHGKENVWILNNERSVEITERIKHSYPEEYSTQFS